MATIPAMPPSKSAPARAPASPESRASSALAWLKRNSSRKVRDGMARYGLPSDHALGVPVGALQKLARQLGRDHALAEELWVTGCYEARLLAAFVGEPAKVTPALMEAWCRDFDNWGVVDTVCFKLFDQSPHAWKKVEPWSKRKGEFQKRAGLVLLACLAGHDRTAGDDAFLRCLPAVERAAADERNFVKKGASWALRRVGRRNAALHAAALASARRLEKSDSPGARWVAKDVIRDLTRAAVQRKVAAR